MIHQTATDLRPVKWRVWEQDVLALLRQLGSDFHDDAIHYATTKPALAAVFLEYAKRIDQLIKRAPR